MLKLKNDLGPCFGQAIEIDFDRPYRRNLKKAGLKLVYNHNLVIPSFEKISDEQKTRRYPSWACGGIGSVE